MKNDIAALTEQITDALNSFAGTARNRPAAATSRPAPTSIPLSTTSPSVAAP